MKRIDRRPNAHPRSLPYWGSLAFVLSGCADEPVGAELLLPEEVSVGWERAYNGHNDGLGALVPVDVMVYVSTTGDPLSDVTVSVWTDDVAAWPVPVEGVHLVAEESDGEQATTAVVYGQEMRAWDATRDQFVTFVPADGLELRTDEGGVARLYLYVDAFPPRAPDDVEGSPFGFGPVRVLVSMGRAEELFWLTPR